jgi:hypothetical protein
VCGLRMLAAKNSRKRIDARSPAAATSAGTTAAPPLREPLSSFATWLLGGRMRKTTIVALARKLLIALWRYTTAGVVIEGAVMKAAPATI